MRNLILVLGDQLDRHSAAFDDFDPARDAIWMAEVAEESTHVWSHQARIALFLSAMRHFAAELSARGWPLHYRRLDEHPEQSLANALDRDLSRLQPRCVRWTKPGDWRVEQALLATLAARGIPVLEVDDRHFYTTPTDFAKWAKGRRELRLEYWYRELRQRFAILMEGDQPIGGQWNFDTDNRGSFDRRGPDGLLKLPMPFVPDQLTGEVLQLVASRFAGHPGALTEFDWPVTASEAQLALDDFIEWRLPLFGRYQDAMWTDQTYLYHSRLAAAMNLKLLAPCTVVNAALAALERGHADIAAVEGFVRQILGWREYVRGLYWLRMPGYLDDNALNANADLPDFYWTGNTDYACLRDTLKQTLRHGYAHHIQRLMVTGLFALLLGVRPRAVHEWYLAIYVDAVEWVELPNTIGMSQYADGGVMASKPYIASGKYIQRMSNYCSGCKFKPDQSTGPAACPFTTLFWDFLIRHQQKFSRHPRTALMWRNLQRLDPAQQQAILEQAKHLRSTLQQHVEAERKASDRG